jgi:hypothetical protein
MEYELFCCGVAMNGDSNVHVTRRTRLCAGRHRKAANQRAGRTGIAKLREDALQCAFDGV